MLPEDHVKSVKHSKYKRKFYKNIGILSGFILTLLLLGPLLHELTHIAWLEYSSCRYTSNLVIDGFGLRGEIQPLCQLSKFQLIIFYSTGYAATLLAGTAFNIAAIELQDSTGKYVYWLSAGTGLMMSVVIGLVSKGDFAEVFKVIGFEPVHAQIFTAALMVSIFLSNFNSIDTILSELEWQE